MLVWRGSQRGFALNSFFYVTQVCLWVFCTISFIFLYNHDVIKTPKSQIFKIICAKKLEKLNISEFSTHDLLQTIMCCRVTKHNIFWKTDVALGLHFKNRNVTFRVWNFRYFSRQDAKKTKKQLLCVHRMYNHNIIVFLLHGNATERYVIFKKSFLKTEIVPEWELPCIR